MMTTNGLTAEFLSSCSGKRRGSLMVAGPSGQAYKRAFQRPSLSHYGVEADQCSFKALLENVGKWDFDVFALTRLSGGRPLFYLAMHLFQEYELIQDFDLDIVKLMKFLNMTEDAYHFENPYHNSTHATDVLQALHCLLQEEIFVCVTRREVLAAMLAAILHDVDHPGVNQAYLIKTSSYLASIHGKQSLLEHHHIQSARAIINESHLLDHLGAVEKEAIMQLMDDLVLGTDFTQHKYYLGLFEGKLNEGVDMRGTLEDRKFVLMMALKCADISNQTRLWDLCQNWSLRIMEEFFRQGDAERDLHLPISFLCDRHSVCVPDSQKGFIQFMALPLFKLWHQLVNTHLSCSIIDHLLVNQTKWEAQIEAQ